MKVTEVTKLTVALAIIISVTILAFCSKIPAEAVTALMGAIIGYILGNATGIVQTNGHMDEIIRKHIDQMHG